MPNNNSQQQARIDAFAAADDIIDNNALFYITRLAVYFLKTQFGWTHFSKGSLVDVFPVCLDSDVRDALTCEMQARGHVFHDVTYSVADVHGKLNLLDMSRWVKPTQGSYHWLFDSLLTALACGDAEKLEHIERLIAYKYSNPDSPRLPALIVHGEGGCGKNMLVEDVLGTLYAGAVVSGTVETVMGAFNTPLLGKVVSLIDEATAKKVNHDKLKNMLGSNVLWANEKGLKQYECPAIAWVIISSNKHEGGIYLDRSRADRRYSIFHIEAGKDIYHWVMPKLDAQFDREHIRSEVIDWMEANATKILRDKTQVSHWIDHLITKHKDKPMPLPFHGADFQRIMDIQKPTEESIIPDVFNDPEFTHINRITFYEGYKLLCKSNDHRFPMSARAFYDKVRLWLKAHKPGMIPCDEKQYRQKVYDAGNKSWEDTSIAWCWASLAADKKDKPHRPNDTIYIDGSDRFEKVWVGPQGL